MLGRLAGTAILADSDTGVISEYTKRWDTAELRFRSRPQPVGTSPTRWCSGTCQDAGQQRWGGFWAARRIFCWKYTGVVAR